MDKREKVIEALENAYVENGAIRVSVEFRDSYLLPLLKDRVGMKFGRWVKTSGNYLTPGGTPMYECGHCGGSNHLYGVEYEKRKIICDNCGQINIYPFETAYEESCSLWDGEESNNL